MNGISFGNYPVPKRKTSTKVPTFGKLRAQQISSEKDVLSYRVPHSDTPAIHFLQALVLPHSIISPCWHLRGFWTLMSSQRQWCKVCPWWGKQGWRNAETALRANWKWPFQEGKHQSEKQSEGTGNISYAHDMSKEVTVEEKIGKTIPCNRNNQVGKLYFWISLILWFGSNVSYNYNDFCQFWKERLLFFLVFFFK